MLLSEITRLKATRVVIDFLSGFELTLASTFREDFRESLSCMVTALTSVGVSVLLTSDLEDRYIAGRLVRVPSEELPRMQALIEGQVQHMSRLVDDLLDVSRASTGKLRLDCHLVDMVQIIHQAIDVCSPLMTSHHVHFTAELPEFALTVEGDPVRLTQILGNLLGNAAKYTPAGGNVTLSVTAQADLLQMSIRDNGIGISAQALPFIFEPFVQDVHAVGFNGAGLGIGLTVVRELVEAHGGTVTGMSQGDGKGSEFVVVLPLVKNQRF